MKLSQKEILRGVSKKKKTTWPVKMEPKKHLEPPGTLREEGFSPRSFERSTALPTTRFQISGVQNCERINFCCFKPPSLW